MGRLPDYYKSVSSWSAEKTRDYLRGHSPHEYNLVDVRQPGEYKSGHLSGAKLIPLGELSSRMHELETDKLTLTYCAVGIRSRAGAFLLQHAGFREVHNLAGGLRAWQGWGTNGFPESDLQAFGATSRPERDLALAWFLEEGTRNFYISSAVHLQPLKAAELFKELAADKEKHKLTIVDIAKEIPGSSPFPLSKQDIPEDTRFKDVMEGGLSVPEILSWSKRKGVREILEIAMAAETYALDRYLTLARNVAGESARKTFLLLSKEEEFHLEKVSRHFDQFV